MSYDLVLGGGGFVGSHLVQALCAEGVHVLCVDRNLRSERLHPLANHRTLDLFTCTDGDLDELISGCSLIYHLAWSSIPASAEADPFRDLKDNVGLAVRVFKASARAGVRVVFSSSGGTVYGEGATAELAEDHPCNPMSAYGAGKRAAEMYAGLFRRTMGLDVRIARLANPYGAGQNPARPQGAVSRFARQTLEGEAIEIWGDGEVVRDYIHISDVIACLVALGQASPDTLKGHAIFNVGSGHGASLKDVLQIVADAVGQMPEVRFLPGRNMDIARNVLSIDRVRSTLGWAPRLNLADGIGALISDLRFS